jgi:dolichol-phosphate mannosyltransferase
VGNDRSENVALSFSVVIPVYNEEENVLPLLEEIERAVAGRPCEVIFVDDASSDGTAAALAPATATGRARLLRHLKRAGQSAAVRTGVRAACGRWIVTLDGDGQNDPADIPNLLKVAEAEPALRLVGGLRAKRRDTWSKRAASRFANGLRQRMLRDDCPDTGCGIKAFERDAYLELPFFGAQHRFLPALFRAYGHRASYVAVGHRPRARGSSKYTNLRRGLIGIVDILGVYWLMRRTVLSPAVEGAVPSDRA